MMIDNFFGVEILGLADLVLNVVDIDHMMVLKVSAVNSLLQNLYYFRVSSF